jgi:hypothetical protein
MNSLPLKVQEARRTFRDMSAMMILPPSSQPTGRIKVDNSYAARSEMDVPQYLEANWRLPQHVDALFQAKRFTNRLMIGIVALLVDRGYSLVYAMRFLFTLIALIVAVGFLGSVIPLGNPSGLRDIVAQHSPCNPAIQICL